MDRSCFIHLFLNLYWLMTEKIQTRYISHFTYFIFDLIQMNIKNYLLCVWVYKNCWSLLVREDFLFFWGNPIGMLLLGYLIERHLLLLIRNYSLSKVKCVFPLVSIDNCWIFKSTIEWLNKNTVLYKSAVLYIYYLTVMFIFLYNIKLLYII